MLINFTDTYIDDINAGITMIGQIHRSLCCKEPFMGNSTALDRMYTISMFISGIIDHLENDDNSNPAENEAFLLCLRSLYNKEICGPRQPPILDVRDYHNATPSPHEGTPFIQGN